jgi:lipopolysaccharide/colanic/teichoic acid biosynthesis glycosyltransferase
MDILVAGTLLLVLLPLIALIAILVRWKLGAPVLFTQTRVGYKTKLFKIYKFRTMANRNGPDGAPLPDAQRMTPFGTFLRNASLDELPQLINVLKGDLSLVGPRPLLVEYIPLYSETQKRRHEVHPGITGWAQVNGRNNITWFEKFRLDVEYVDRKSLLFDLKILVLTLFKVLKRSDISQTNRATADKFNGSN